MVQSRAEENMADPRISTLADRMRADPLSPLMRAMAKRKKGEKINACPFGCADQHLDEHGYCRHLVGFTRDGKTYEPMFRTSQGRRVVRTRKRPVDDDMSDIDPIEDIENFTPVLEPILELVEEGDVLVRITIDSRVYRKNPRKPLPAPESVPIPAVIPEAMHEVVKEAPREPVKEKPPEVVEKKRTLLPQI